MASTYDPNVHVAESPLAGNADFIAAAGGVWENHEAIYATHAPPILATGRTMTDTNVSVKEWMRWRVRGNLDLHTVRWRAHLTPAGGTPSVFVRVGTAQTAANVTGAGWLNVDVTPVAGGVQDCLMLCDAPAPGLSLTGEAALVRLVPVARVTRQASGYVGDDEAPDDALVATSVEHLDRLERGPLLTARDRPACVFGIAPKIDSTMGAKSAAEWVAGNTTNTDIAGHGVMPAVDERPRRYIIDAFVAQSAAGTCAAELRVGSWRWQIPATGSWQAIEVVLPVGPLPVVGAVTAEVGVWAQFQGVQIWRL